MYLRYVVGSASSRYSEVEVEILLLRFEGEYRLMKMFSDPVTISLGRMQTSAFFVCGLLILLPISSFGVTTYVSQNGGTFSGGTACNGQSAVSIATFDASKPNAGDVVWLCGTLTTYLGVYGSGTSRSHITVNWDSGAKISLPYCNSKCIDTSTNQYIDFNGGTACGPGTTCNSTEHSGGSVATGVIEATANGSSLANQVTPTQGILIGGGNITISNMIIRNLYVHSSSSDTCCDAYGVEWVASGVTVHDSTLHDVSVGVFGGSSGTSGGSNLTVYNNDIYNTNWGLSGGTATGQVNSNWLIHDNHFGAQENWDDAADHFHHDRVFLYDGCSGCGNFNGVYIYNNLFDGATGANGTAQMYWGGGSEQNAYVFNNIFNNGGQANGLDNALLEETGGSADTVWNYNNTIIGAGAGVEVQDCVQLEGSTVIFENNVVTGCNTLVLTKSDTPAIAADYNQYAGASKTSVWDWGASGTNCTTLSCWQTATGGESHSAYYSSQSSLDINGSGVPQAGSPLLGAGTNLTSSCSGSLTALCSTSSAGDTMTPVARASSGAWDVGAVGDPSDPPPAPPTGLNAVIQ